MSGDRPPPPCTQPKDILPLGSPTHRRKPKTAAPIAPIPNFAPRAAAPVETATVEEAVVEVPDPTAAEPELELELVTVTVIAGKCVVPSPVGELDEPPAPLDEDTTTTVVVPEEVVVPEPVAPKADELTVYVATRLLSDASRLMLVELTDIGAVTIVVGLPPAPSMVKSSLCVTKLLPSLGTELMFSCQPPPLLMSERALNWTGVMV